MESTPPTTAVASVPDSSRANAHVEGAEAKPAWDDAPIMPFPKLLPMESPYTHSEYVVRDCYPEYYELVLGLLKEKKAQTVTVTGAPGIGKSVFYAYFFQRYSFENAKKTIVTAAFELGERGSKMKKVVVWRGGQVVGQAEDDLPAMERLLSDTKKRVAKEEGDNGLIYLYDGPPDAWPSDAPMVCFTGPKGGWFEYVRISSTRPKLIMPLWDERELFGAAVDLDLSEALEKDGSLSDGLDQRFHLFGGVARDCLSTDEDYLQAREDLIEKTVMKIPNVATMKYLCSHPEGEWLENGIFNYVPSAENPSEYTIEEGSKYVHRLMVQRLGELKAKRK